MPETTLPRTSPREETLNFLRTFARAYSALTHNEEEARRIAQLAASPLGSC